MAYELHLLIKQQVSMKTVNILLIEDDPLDAINLRRNVDKLNIQYQINTAVNGEEALKYLDYLKNYRRKLPDLVFLDLNMPRMNGIEFLRTIRESKDYNHLKCFMISGSNQVVDKKTAKLLGISGYLVKPLKFNDINHKDSMEMIVNAIGT